MAKRPDLVDITSITNSSTINAINQNWDRIQEAFDNTVSLDGSTPNAMNGDLDINGNAILNVGTIDADNLTLNGQTVTDLASVPEWRGAWLTGTSYAKNDLAKTNGNVYICLEAHTSGTFSTDLTMVKWELMVSKGDSGGGTGDLLASNNLSDVSNVATARANLGLGTVATENTVPVSKGGTGATDAAGARTALGAQTAGATLNSLEALSLVAGDTVYATAADTLARRAIGSTGQVLTVSGGVPTWADPASDVTIETAVQTNTGSSVNYVIPTGTTWIDIYLDEVSSNGTANVVIRPGTGGTPVSTGYDSVCGNRSSEDFTTNGFNITRVASSDEITGVIHLQRRGFGSSFWVASGTAVDLVNNRAPYTIAGNVTLGGNIDYLRITVPGDTFDKGYVNIIYG